MLFTFLIIKVLELTSRILEASLGVKTLLSRILDMSDYLVLSRLTYQTWTKSVNLLVKKTDMPEYSLPFEAYYAKFSLAHLISIFL